MASVRIAAQLEGMDKLLESIRECDGNVKKSVKGAVRAGAKVIGGAANANAKSITSTPGRAVSVRVRARQGYTVASIFPAKGHAELRPIETGTSAGRRVAKKGKFKFYAGNRLVETRAINHPGTAARPWLRPAFDANKDAAVDAVGKTLRQAAEEARIAAEGADE